MKVSEKICNICKIDFVDFENNAENFVKLYDLKVEDIHLTSFISDNYHIACREDYLECLVDLIEIDDNPEDIIKAIRENFGD